MSAQPKVSCVVKVGGGRGFVIEQRVTPPRSLASKGLPLRKHISRRLVVTAAHCLPNLQAAHSFPDWDGTYKDLLAVLEGEPSVWAQCVFANPVADIAVLGAVDGQELPGEADAFDQLVESAAALEVGEARSGRGWVLSLKNIWTPTSLEVFRGVWGTGLSIDPTLPGMSGSPILNRAGRALGVVTIGNEIISNGVCTNERAWGQSILMRDLPPWLLS